MPFFQTPHGYSLHYELHGDASGGDKVLLIMGFACCKTYWGPLVERLIEWGSSDPLPATSSQASSASSNTPPSVPSTRYQICCFDSRGFGLSGDSLARYSSSSLAQDCKALLMHLGWVKAERDLLAQDLKKNRGGKREAVFLAHSADSFVPPPLHLCGWSMGGMVATELTLELARWAAERQPKPTDPPVMDLRSSVIVSSSRGGFTHRADRHDAPPVLLVSSDNNQQSQAKAASDQKAALSSLLAPSSLLKRFLFRSSVGRWGWGRTWLLRNLPPTAALWTIFRCVFLSLYHSRIERVLELHYSKEFLAQPYQPPQPKSSKTGNGKSNGSHSHAPTTHNAPLPSAASLSHLPQASAAMTSAAASTIEIRRDASTGGFVWSQGEDASPSSNEGAFMSPEEAEAEEAAQSQSPQEPTWESASASSPNGSTASTAAAAAGAAQEVLLGHADKDLEGGASLHLTPAQKQRVLEKNENESAEVAAGAEADAGEERPASADVAVAAASFGTPLKRSPPSQSSSSTSSTTTPQLPEPQSWPNSFNTTLVTPPPPPGGAAAGGGALTRSSSLASTATSASASSSRPKVLTNRDVLSSQYLLRAPFDRWIFLYGWALFGHGLTCLTHHVSRARIASFMAQQRALRLQRPPPPHRLRMLVITGSADILVHPSNSYHLSEQFQCPLYVLENVGHMVHVEVPDAFAQLLHAHFTRMPIEHLQAYVHGTPTRASTPSGGGNQQPSSFFSSVASPPTHSPHLSRLESDPARSRLSVTRMDDGGSSSSSSSSSSVAAGSAAATSGASDQANPALSLHERAELAAHGGRASRRHSFLVQIDDSVGGAGPGGLFRNESTSSLAAAAGSPDAIPSAVQTPQLRSRSLHRRGSSSSSSLASLTDPFLQRTPSMRELKRDRAQLRTANCCVRAMVRITALPLSTALACSAMMVALPKQMLRHVLHPSLLLSLPTRLFGAFKRTIGGAVLQRTTEAEPAASDPLLSDAPVARITTA